MPRDKIDSEVHKKRGKRLRECRKLRNMTQEEFAEAIGKSVNLVSMMENGGRTISLERAIKYAKILNVSPRYLMLETDLMLERYGQTTIDYSLFGELDRGLIQYLQSMGYEIFFYVVKLYDGKMPEEVTDAPQLMKRDLYGKVHDWDALNIKATFDQLREFCLSDAKCKLIEGEEVSEVVIKRAVINNVALTYGSFVFLMNRLIDYIKFTVDHLKDFVFDFNYCGGMQSATEMEIEESRFRIGGLTDIGDIIKVTDQDEMITAPDGKKMKLSEYMQSDNHKLVESINNSIKNKKK